MKVAAVVGPSGSGKTTLLRAVIARLVSEGFRVAAIKHTHHPLDDRDRGDTALFRKAGANPVILARDGEAIRFDQSGTSRFVFESPAELPLQLKADVVLIEGFHRFDGWPRITLAAEQSMTETEARSILDRIWLQTP